jgi:hypothetical protein
MKHGDQANAKSAKAKASPAKTAVAKSSKAAGAPSKTKNSSSGKAIPKKGAAPAAAFRDEDSGKSKGAAKGDGGKASAAKSGGKATPRAAAPEPEGFSNPLIAAAFERAVKKYPNAFRRLTD